MVGEATVQLGDWVEQRTGALSPPDARLRTLLESRGERWRSLLLSRPITFAERGLYAGDRVVVLGPGRWDLDEAGDVGGAGYRDVPARVLVMQARHVCVPGGYLLPQADDGTRRA